MSSSPPGPPGDGPRFAVVGAYVIDCIARTDRMPEWGETHEGESVHMAPGGKALNMAVALARMGAHVDAIGVVGDDLAGQTVVEALVREGVGIEGLEVRPGGRTPICVCFSRTDGETAFLWRIDDSVAMDASTIHGVGRAPLAASDTTIVTFEAPAAVHDALGLAKTSGALVVLSPAPINPAVCIGALPWDDVDVLVPNEAEAIALLHAVGCKPPEQSLLADALADATGVGTVIVTLGSAGVVVRGQTYRQHSEAPGIERAVDTTGASDVFTAAFVHQLSLGIDLTDAASTGQRAAGLSIGTIGGYDSLPVVSDAWENDVKRFQVSRELHRATGDDGGLSEKAFDGFKARPDR